MFWYLFIAVGVVVVDGFVAGVDAVAFGPIRTKSSPALLTRPSWNGIRSIP